ncbi:alpha/beta fold hydrolase [Desulforhopalus singaporensis]|uniref:Pimeloyl-ACP methyl ester carboxylesterase n=1 Tax=Desulforhopalus singaporensis TaxID=91360 RepID=A0A1H0MG11_9BACT|nr:alpha/beta hydrolase [Desulforhopalus singaporensis]SDO79344.1 Pimeloyl-ACP methyl ester carboxylesterase [Desulforhopalus singaporensis]
MPSIQIGDINIYYEIHGRGDALLFIHGLGSSSQDWESQVSFFASNYKVVTVDLRGHGKSDKPKEQYSVEMFSADIAALLIKLSLYPVHVVGVSMGAAVGWHLALDYPELVKSLVITNMAATISVRTLAEKWRFYSRVAVVRLLGMGTMGKIIAKNLFPDPNQRNLRREMKKRWSGNDPHSYLNSLLALKNWSIAERLENIVCPVLVVSAEYDYAPLEHVKNYTAKMRNAELVRIEGSHHALPVERPEAYNRTVENFLVKAKEWQTGRKK